ncbi:Tex family protein [Candidatus Formimonas warabiya]|uniref:RNA-binding transcriptional accessory protein n=1 Tax=Formimonas warabiya TaxID=1761012 RepID=A0A3G1KW59_FORW1|nr:Tex family protein [Candidatus Formimonas warabiya]ATW26599.1 RNA-binding transcriptional accessory protein [Candidatus Formimonas warabiya]
MTVDIPQIISGETKIPLRKVLNTIELLDQGNTVPFIARYRKEATGELDENQIREIEERLKFHRNLEQRKTEIIRLIDEQGKLTDELREKILSALKPTELEDLYLPYRQKKKTRASMAREKGLEPLALYLLTFPKEGSPEREGEKYASEQVADAAAALQGAMDIVAEMISEDAQVRKWVREYTQAHGFLVVQAKDAKKDSVYRMYYENYREAAAKIVPHRVLAVNRGEREGFLTVSLDVNEEVIFDWLYRRFVKEGVTGELVRKAAVDAYKRLVAPSIEREVRNQLTEQAENHAVTIFAKNLRSLLLQPPVKGKIVLGLDPAYRTGCKWAVMDATGKVLEVGVIYPTPPHNKIPEAEQELARLVRKYRVQAVVIGNGTASRETEQFVAEFIKKSNNPALSYTIVSEAGASVYSASKLAAKEFPKLDVAERSAISIGRRIQDPLAELVKIPPQAAGVGQYQHDIPEKRLEENLSKVVESVVNFVGVDLNTASAPLLSYVAGINATVASNIVTYRDETGGFKSRAELKQVPKLGPKTFEQCAGFLRISQGDFPLDGTAIHPESYRITDKLLKNLDLNLSDIGTKPFIEQLTLLKKNAAGIHAAAEKIGAGVPTLTDIIDSLARPGRDPREELAPPIFRTDVLKIEDLKPGMILKGQVHNVTDFGAFIDIGVKQDGLVHVSEIADRFIRHPLEALSIGDVVTVGVLAVDPQRSRISLTMKGVKLQ